ncbi:hypothetical protein EBZ80_22895 [bacterium]|nr:hypothetical protein [bacterium]
MKKDEGARVTYGDIAKMRVSVLSSPYLLSGLASEHVDMVAAMRFNRPPDAPARPDVLLNLIEKAPHDRSLESELVRYLADRPEYIPLFLDMTSDTFHHKVLKSDDGETAPDFRRPVFRQSVRIQEGASGGGGAASYVDAWVD